MNGIYIVNYDDEFLLPINLISKGINKKILKQVKFFQTYFEKFELVMPEKHTQSIKEKVLYRIPFYKKCYNLDTIRIDFDIDFVYLRRPEYFSKDFLYYLKVLKKRYNCKIVMEFPTYPYSLEYFKRLVDIPFLFKDMYNRRKLRTVVDKIATLTDDKSIYGIETIKIENGIDIKDPEYFEVHNKMSDAIRLIMVANFEYWHGLDRLLIGLGEYYKINGRRRVVLDIVGPIPKQLKKRYDKIVKKYSISNYIRFYGSMNNQAINDLYKEAHIGICSLGCHRKKISRSQDIKSREYLAHLLPIVGSSVDVINDYEVPFLKKADENDSPINIDEIINMFDICYDKDGNFEYSVEVIQFVKNMFSIEECMKGVIENMGLQ